MNLTTMTRQEVLDFMEEHEISVGISYEDDECQYWGFTGRGGFHTFDAPFDEDKAMYASVLCHRLLNECNITFGDAERLAMAYVEIYKVMQKPMSEEEQEEVRKKLMEAIDSGNLEVAMPEEPNISDIPLEYDDCETEEMQKRWVEREAGETEWQAKMADDAGAFDDPPYDGFYESVEDSKTD